MVQQHPDARLSNRFSRVVNTIGDRARLGAYVRRLDCVPPCFVARAASEVLGPQTLSQLVKASWPNVPRLAAVMESR